MSRPKNPDLAQIRRLYEESLKQHGVTPPGVGWRDPVSHALRFSKLAAVIAVRDESFSVNDLGCGYGAYYEWLVNNGYRVGHFRGHDISEKMLAEARVRFPAAEFAHGERLGTPADYSFACGIFNVRLEAGEDDWRAHIEATLDNLNAFSLRGFAFNLLTTYVDYREPHLYYGDPCYFFDFCKRRFSKKVSLLHDYRLFEWTIHVVK